MAKRITNHLRLGIFVMAGLLFLVTLLYVIGKNQNLFGSTFLLKARFENVNGLMPGNNVRFAGITAGTVKEVRVLNDTTIEVEMLIKNKMREFIKKNTVATIGSDGLMGNKLVNLASARENAPLVEENDILVSGRAADTDQMLKVLSGTTDDLTLIVAGLKETITRINTSDAFWDLLNDRSIPASLKSSLAGVRQSAIGMNAIVNDLNSLVSFVKSGQGSVGSLLVDTAFSHNLNEAVNRLKRAGDVADSIALQVNTLVSNVDRNINHGNGMITALLKDSGMVRSMENSLYNIQQGTEAFHQNMEALKSNFLFRGYFRRLEKEKKNN